MTYTFGYNGQRPADIDWFTQRFNAVFVDIRMSAKSARPEWNKPSLERLLGDRYVHLPELGNRNYNAGGPIKIANMDAGIAELVRMSFGFHERDLVIMCGCRDRTGCHRDTVAGEITRRFHFDLSELRFTWTKNMPKRCPICSDRFHLDIRIKPDARSSMTCGHTFFWRPNANS